MNTYERSDGYSTNRVVTSSSVVNAEMYPDEGPSYTTRLVDEDQTSSVKVAEDRVTIDVEIKGSNDNEDQNRTARDVVLPKNRSLSLADDYEVIGGVPVIVWKRREATELLEEWLYTFSHDGTRMAVREGYQLICIYDVTDNFSPIAKETVEASSWVDNMVFWKHLNDKLVLCHDDKASLYGIRSMQCPNEEERSSLGVLNLLNLGTIAEDSHSSQYQYAMTSFKSSTLICSIPTDLRRATNVVDIFRVESETEPFKHIRVVAARRIHRPFIHFADNGHVCIVANEFTQRKTSDTYEKDRAQEISSKLLTSSKRITTPKHLRVSPIVRRTLFTTSQQKGETTHILRQLRFDDSQKEKQVVVIDETGLCLSNDGKFFIARCTDISNKTVLGVYKTTGNNLLKPSYSKELGYDILEGRAQFVYKCPSICEEQQDAPLDVLFVGYVVTQATRTMFMIWNCVIDKIVWEIDISIEKENIHQMSSINFSVSSDDRWLAVGFTPNLVALFSIATRALVWKVELSPINEVRQTFVKPQFDPSNCKLIVHVEDALYAFIPPCLIENYKIDFESLTFDLDFRSSISLLNINEEYQHLMSKDLLWRLLEFDQGMQEFKEGLSKIDVANSINKQSIALLIQAQDMISILYGSLRSVFISWYKMSSVQEIEEYEMPQDVTKVPVLERFNAEFGSDNDLPPLHVFLYQNLQDKKENVAIFCIKDKKIIGLFISLEQQDNQETKTFSDEGDWHACFSQSKDGRYVYVMSHNIVMIIDLCEKVESDVKYNIDIRSWFTQNKHEKELKQYDISLDGKTILIGWNKDNEQRVLIRSSTTQEEFDDIKAQKNSIVECCAMGDDFERVAFIKHNEDNETISSIRLYNHKNRKQKDFDQDNLNPHVNTMLKNISKESYVKLAFDQSKGTIWIIVLTKKDNKDHNLIWIPVEPYCMEGCIPSLGMRDFPKQELDIVEWKRLTDIFGIALYNMSFNGTTNFHYFWSKASDESSIKMLLKVASDRGIFTQYIWNQYTRGKGLEIFLKTSIDDKKEAFVRFFVELIHDNILSFEEIAMTMSKCFNHLWKDYQTWMETMLREDGLVWNFGEVSVPSDIFQRKDSRYILVGTTEYTKTWKTEKGSDKINISWRRENEKAIKTIETKCSPTKTNAALHFICIQNVCKIGLEGILRYLILKNAPSYIYKTTLVKGVIDWKWQYIWRKRCWKDLVVYAVLLVLFSIYAICLSYIGRDLRDTLPAMILLSCLLFVVMVLASWFLLKEYFQLQAYRKDGKVLFPGEQWWGVRQYFRSTWNIVEVTTYIWVLTFIPTLHVLCMVTPKAMPYLVCVVSIETVMIWTKFYYYAQAWEGFGSLVLMVENVIKDCVYFLILACLILVGFGLALFTVLQYCIDDEEDDTGFQSHPSSKRNEVERHYSRLTSEQSSTTPAPDTIEDDNAEDKIASSFHSPHKAILTLFYAMVGTFEPEIYYRCKSFTPVVAILFVAYVSIQLIVMLNMLISIMGDTFDKVKDTEEEQLLLGRARIIDACEASLNPKEIKQLEEEDAKYLYILLPKKEMSDRKERLWKGRVRTIEERIQVRLEHAHDTVVEKIDQKIKRSTEACKTLLEERITSVEAKLKDKMMLVKETVEEKVTSVEDKMTERMQEVCNEIRLLTQAIQQISGHPNQ